MMLAVLAVRAIPKGAALLVEGGDIVAGIELPAAPIALFQKPGASAIEIEDVYDPLRVVSIVANGVEGDGTAIGVERKG